jgi:hypothetical protein
MRDYADMDEDGRVEGTAELLAGPPPGRSYVSEEDAKVRWIVPLLESLGHDRNRDMSFEVPISWQTGTTTKTGFADIVVYLADIPIVIVETKKPGKTLNEARDQAITYAKAYSPIVPFVLAHDKDRVVLYRASAQKGRIGEYVLVDGLPSRPELLALIGFEEVPPPGGSKAEAVARVVHSEHYRYLLDDCVRVIIRAGTTGVGAVSELAKLLLVKRYHEANETGSFQPGANIKQLFDEAKADYPGMFKAGESIRLNRTTFDAVVAKLNEIETL